jgi:putative oxygen-independent coproporphyrinogen III oxidase
VSKDPLAIYIHWPFCQKICPYCDFNVHTETDIDQETWRAALVSELDHYAAETAEREVNSIYFGGGTPSLMPADTTAAVIDHIRATWPVSETVEITLEANPTSSEIARLGDFKGAGINRLSLGIQSFEDTALKFLGRDHSGHEARIALEAAQTVFDRVTFDLIYALPDQNETAWAETLNDALNLGTAHLSLYQLTIESGTAFMREGVQGADEDKAADMYELTQEILGRAGMAAYEISNHAKPGEESRHNLHTWRGQDYIGIGPGAHGRLTEGTRALATHQIHTPTRWLKKIMDEGHGTAKRRALSPNDRAQELVMMGLRMREGVDVAHIERQTGAARTTFLDSKQISMIVDAGLLRETGSRLDTTREGRAMLNSVLEKILVF